MQNEWQPIETAKKREKVHIWLYEGSTTKKMWRGYYCKESKGWICGATSDDHTVAWMMRINPTHWRDLPLPPPPQSDEVV